MAQSFQESTVRPRETLVVLKSWKEWDDWWFVVKDVAKKADIWEYVNPDAEVA